MATYYFRNTGTNWNLTSSWSLTSFPTYTPVTTVPGIADTALFEASSSNCTITAVAAAADRIDFTNGGTSNYTGSFTVNALLTISRSLALSPSMSDVTGSSSIMVRTGSICAITSSGKSIHNLLSIGNTFTNTILNLADTLTVADSLSTNAISGNPTTTFNGGDVVIRKSAVLINNTRGTSTFYLSPLTGQTANLRVNGFGNMGNNLIISGAGVVNFDTLLFYTGGKITYVTASNITFTGNHNLNAQNCILDTGGMTWNRHDLQNGNQTTNTLSSSLNISGSFSFNNGGFAVNRSGSARINAYGNISLSGTGNSRIAIPLTITGSASGRIIDKLEFLNSCDIEVKINGGSITFPSTITNFNSATPTKIYNNSTGGTINAASTTLVAVNLSSLILDTNTISWGGLTLQGNNTITLSSSFTASNMLLNVGGIFTGSAGWICSNLTSSSPNGRTITLASGVEYKTTNDAYLSGSTGGVLVMSSSIPSTRASWSLASTASQYIKNVNGYKIDSSNGQTIYTTGTIFDTINWNPSSPSLSYSYVFFID